MKYIVTGLESSGKSLKLAMIAEKLLIRNKNWLTRQQTDYRKLGPAGFLKKYRRETPYARPIASNMHFSKIFEERATRANISIKYWRHKHELILMEETDIICDEVANYWNSRMWQDMSTDELQWLSQGAKRGIEFYGASQDFAMVDKGFRRLTNRLFFIYKVIGSARPSATKPPVNRVWGLCLVFEMDPRLYKEDEAVMQRKSLIPDWYTIQKKYCELFDTNERIKRSEAIPLRHVERGCELPECTFHKTMHV